MLLYKIYICDYLSVCKPYFWASQITNHDPSNYNIYNKEIFFWSAYYKLSRIAFIYQISQTKSFIFLKQ